MVQKINIISVSAGNNGNGRYTCLDNVVASIAETGKPYIANDDGATLSGDEDSGWVLAPSAGLVYQLKEGATLREMAECDAGDWTVGDGGTWEPAVTVHGGESGFYRVFVGK